MPNPDRIVAKAELDALFGSLGVLRQGYVPTDQNLTTWTGNPFDAGSAELMGAAGVATGARFYLPTASPIPRVWLNVVAAAGASLTPGQNYGALWDAAGNVLDQSDDQTTKWSSAGVKDLVFPSSSVIRPAGWYDCGWWWNGTGTAPQIARGSKSALNNLGLSGRMIRFWTFGSGFTSTAPSLGTKIASNVAWWLGAGAS